jgi:hypothetical protein
MKRQLIAAMVVVSASLFGIMKESHCPLNSSEAGAARIDRPSSTVGLNSAARLGWTLTENPTNRCQ